ncbi:hypothetical protein [Pseudoflavonifractor sp. An184]|uniref:hypothetical protein n=1 Tax=Pseudoflavonifractor sp. An184 TaxID=1965576 RepID=UPI001121C852|nr:hypothetical protein [Pseudoflavonifractor sp. An184]
MKKVSTILLSSLLCITCSVPASASSPLLDQMSPTEISTETLVIDGNTFPIVERIDNSHTVTRTYESDSPVAVKSIDTTKSLLISLGMNEESINKLSTDALNFLAESDDISISVSYSSFDAATGELTYLPKEEALQAAAELSAQQDAYISEHGYPSVPEISTFGTKPNESDVPGEFLDSYMEMTHTVAHKGAGKYLFTTDATWLTMPFFRGYDSIGSCAMDCTVTPSTAEGSITYDIAYVMAGSETTYSDDEETIGDIQWKSKEGWAGIAGVFNLPDNVVSDYVGGMDIIYSNVHAHFEYSGHVASPDETRWFNSIATYDHSTFNIDVSSPTVGIDLSGNVSASIGLSLNRSTDTRNAIVEVTHSA